MTQRTASEILENFLSSQDIRQRSALVDELISLSRKQREERRSKIATLRAENARLQAVVAAAGELNPFLLVNIIQEEIDRQELGTSWYAGKLRVIRDRLKDFTAALSRLDAARSETEPCACGHLHGEDVKCACGCMGYWQSETG